MPDIAIIGPGAIGGTVAAWLAQSPGNRVTLCVRTPIDTLTVETPARTITARPRVLTAPESGKPMDWVLIATKAYDVAPTARWFPGLVGPETRVAVLQNGVEHVARFLPFLARQQIMPVVIDMPAERTAPDHIRQRGAGMLTVADDADGRRLVDLFAGTDMDVRLTGDFKSVAWRKLALNCAGIVNAVTMQPAGIARFAPAADIMRALIQECMAVGRAEGATLVDTLADDIVAATAGRPADSVNSLHADRIYGRPMEIDARNGVIVRLGRQHGIPTPVNQLMAALLEAAVHKIA